MPAVKKLTTTLSTKGQMVLPKAVRDRRGWGEGVRLVVEDTPQGVLLREEAPASLFPPTRLEDVFGMLRHDGPALSVEDMKIAVLEEAGRRWARFERTGSDDEDDGAGGAR